MRRVLLVLLAFVLIFNAECKDLMQSSKITCALKPTVSLPNCHSKAKQKSNKDDCQCSEKKAISIKDDSSNLDKNHIRIVLLQRSPLNTNFHSVTPNKEYVNFLEFNFIFHSQTTPTKTIHLLI